MSPSEPIAIVGQACLLPGALDPDALWRLVVENRSALGPVPRDRWGIERARMLAAPGDSLADRASCDVGGYVTGFDFDPDGYAVPAAELVGLDRLFHFILHVGRHALAGASGVDDRGRIGAVIGNLSYPSASLARYAERTWLGDALADRLGIGPIDPRNRFMSGLPAHLLARALGLGAGAFAIDAACASSLYAIKAACDALHDRRADLMLAGAVNCADDLFIHAGFTALGALSPTGQSRPFHAAADGLVPGEGAAMLALRRLSDAERCGDRILGVIRGIGVSNDGRGRGLLVPSAEGQLRALRSAYAQAGLEPADVDLVECHATGTSVGDAVEVSALAELFAARSSAAAIGSLKANIGHLITVAGAAGVMKVLGAMQHEMLPPAPHVDSRTSALDGAPLALLDAPTPWRATNPRRAAVSAFGFGGNNAHLILEEAPRRPSRGRVARTAPAPRPIAIVAMGARVGSGTSTADFAAALFTGAPVERSAREVVLPTAGLRFPPRDLEQTLPQQLAILAAASEAIGARTLPRERTAVFIGMQCDAEIARHGARWRSVEWGAALSAPAAWVAETRDAFIPLLGAAGVIGAMPNIPANRLSSHFDLGAASHTVSAEELSGIRALELAQQALQRGEIDAALVGAVDLSCEPVQRAAGLADGEPGDAAIVLLLRRLEDAVAASEDVLAVIDDVGGDEDGLELGDAKDGLTARFGHAHAASGLLRVAAAVLSCAHRHRPAMGPSPVPWHASRPRRARVHVAAMAGERATVHLREGTRARDDGGAAHESFVAQLRAGAFVPAPPVLRYPAHRPTPRVPDLPAPTPSVQTMRPAPRLAPVSTMIPRPRPTSHSMAALGPLAERYLAEQANVAALHRDWLVEQAALHEQFLAVRARGLALLQGGLATPPLPLAASVPDGLPRVEIEAAPAPGELPGPRFSRAQLEVHAAGKISALFGAAFAAQDEHDLQVRMPQPPLLLADRVVGLDAEPGSMGLGTVWTETDVTADSWYLNRGYMPAGVLIEAGQADLFLVSYLGIDAVNRGERAYRLLGCELTYHGSLPRPGDTLRYDIHVDGHARQGDIGLFFFHYDCVIGDRAVLTVREGQAGFFSREELANSAGILWSPSDHAPKAGARLDAPAITHGRRSFGADEVRAFAAGDLHACFGDGFELGRTHVRTPSIQSGGMLLMERVLDLDVRGGPAERGYLKVALPIHADDWFFRGHFKNDPCMPGTLMFEGCLQAMAFYLAALGYTVARDGWRFEPIAEETYKLQCRGQVLPSSKELLCEVFVEEIHDGPIPMLYADLLGTVDGHKAFHARRVGLRLVPDWPLSDRPQLLEGHDSRPSAEADGFRFDYASLLACAWGRPSLAFGPMYGRFDGTRRVARLPGPPYHFMSRVRRIDGALGVCRPGATIEIEYDVPPTAWYFAENGRRVMPFAVLLEAVLQPCGWLASFVGSALTEDEDLLFRNLDGSGRVLAEVGPDSGTLRTITTITGISRSAGMILETFSLRCYAGDVLVCELTTGFGFFPKAALANQVGLPTTEAQRATLTARSAFHVDLRADAPKFLDGELRLPGTMLRMIDRVTAYDATGGTAGLGSLRAEKDVDAGEWFFKAHFFQDPVQPGSLGIEAMLQLLQFFLLERGLDAGIVAPRFQPIALDEEVTWKYRGQVTPVDRRVTVTLEVTSVGRDERGAYATADASLWVDGKRIYEARALGMRIVSAAPAPVPAVGLARTFWRRWFGVASPPVDDLYRGLVGRFLGALHVEDPAALERAGERGVLFLGNHQTAIESTIFAIVASALVGAPILTLAKKENAQHWLALLMKHTFAYPGLRDPRMTEHFDRADPASLPGIIESLGEALASGRSVMVHVEGTRSLECRTPVTQLSGSFLEMAIAVGRPIVPVRFTGGLPTTPLAERLELPLGMGTQDYFIGRPIAPEMLAPLDYRSRRALVIDAINALGIRNEDEGPSPADPLFEAGVHAWMRRAGTSLGHATLYRILEALPDASAEIRALVDGTRVVGHDAWLSELARRLRGELFDADRA